MYICICNAVTERQIRQAVDLGCDSIKRLSRELGVARCCGKCVAEACRVIDEQVAVLYSDGGGIHYPKSKDDYAHDL